MSESSARVVECFREPIYEKCAEVVASHREPGKFESLLDDLREVLPDAPAYLLRTCLRFWRQGDPPLLNLTRRRYHVVSKRFMTDAKAMWKALPEHEDHA